MGGGRCRGSRRTVCGVVSRGLLCAHGTGGGGGVGVPALCILGGTQEDILGRSDMVMTSKATTCWCHARHYATNTTAAAMALAPHHTPPTSGPSHTHT